jgi:hypothetical protein
MTFSLQLKDKLGLLGRLGNKTIGDLKPEDVISVGHMFKQVLDIDEANGILSLIRDDSNIGDVAVKWLSKAADSGKLDFLKVGKSATPDLDLDDDDYFSRCPECKNPQLLNLKLLPPNQCTTCQFCEHAYKVLTD